MSNLPSLSFFIQKPDASCTLIFSDFFISLVIWLLNLQELSLEFRRSRKAFFFVDCVKTGGIIIKIRKYSWAPYLNRFVLSFVCVMTRKQHFTMSLHSACWERKIEMKLQMEPVLIRRFIFGFSFDVFVFLTHSSSDFVIWWESWGKDEGSLIASRWYFVVADRFHSPEAHFTSATVWTTNNWQNKIADSSSDIK